MAVTDPPTILYKYLCSDRLKTAIPVDGNATLRVTQPGGLNDPFECVPALKSAFDPARYEEHAATYSQMAPDNPMSEGAFAHHAEGDGVRLVQNRIIEQLDQKFGIISLTTKPTNALMWSHYAEGGAGFVIGYDFEVLDSLVPSNNGALGPVTYEKKRTTIESAKEVLSGGTALTKVMLTKSIDWKYEDEWRLILPLEAATRTGIQVPGRSGGLDLFTLSIPPKAIIEAYYVGEELSDEGISRAYAAQYPENRNQTHDYLQEALGRGMYNVRHPTVLRRSLRTFDYESC